MVESFGCLIIFYIGLKCHFNYFVLYIYIYIYIRRSRWNVSYWIILMLSVMPLGGDSDFDISHHGLVQYK